MFTPGGVHSRTAALVQCVGSGNQLMDMDQCMTTGIDLFTRRFHPHYAVLSSILFCMKIHNFMAKVTAKFIFDGFMQSHKGLKD